MTPKWVPTYCLGTTGSQTVICFNYSATNHIIHLSNEMFFWCAYANQVWVVTQMNMFMYNSLSCKYWLLFIFNLFCDWNGGMRNKSMSIAAIIVQTKENIYFVYFRQSIKGLLLCMMYHNKSTKAVLWRNGESMITQQSRNSSMVI